MILSSARPTLFWLVARCTPRSDQEVACTSSTSPSPPPLRSCWHVLRPRANSLAASIRATDNTRRPSLPVVVLPVACRRLLEDHARRHALGDLVLAQRERRAETRQPLTLTPAPLRSSSSPPPLSASFSFSSLSSPAPCFHLRIRPWRARHLRGLRLGEDCLVLSPCSGPPPHRPFLSVSQPLQSVVACGRTAVGLMAQSSCATEHAVFLASGVVRVVPAAIQDAGIAWPSIYMLSVFCSRRPEPLCGWL